MHRAYVEGLMPVQMSYSGRNFDIVTGITALALGAWLATGRDLARLVLAWNTLGVVLLANILIVALLSAPTPFRVFMNEPANVWITHAPWVWLPTVMVFAAVFGHVVVYRRLAARCRLVGRVSHVIGERVQLLAKRLAEVAGISCSSSARSMHHSHSSRSRDEIEKGRWRARSRGWPFRSTYVCGPPVHIIR